MILEPVGLLLFGNTHKWGIGRQVVSIPGPHYAGITHAGENVLDAHADKANA